MKLVKSLLALLIAITGLQTTVFAMDDIAGPMDLDWANTSEVFDDVDGLEVGDLSDVEGVEDPAEAKGLIAWAQSNKALIGKYAAALGVTALAGIGIAKGIKMFRDYKNAGLEPEDIGAALEVATETRSPKSLADMSIDELRILQRKAKPAQIMEIQRRLGYIK